MRPFQLRRLQLYDMANLCSIYSSYLFQFSSKNFLLCKMGRTEVAVLFYLIFYSVGLGVRVLCQSFLLFTCTSVCREREKSQNKQETKEREWNQESRTKGSAFKSHVLLIWVIWTEIYRVVWARVEWCVISHCWIITLHTVSVSSTWGGKSFLSSEVNWSYGKQMELNLMWI